MGEYFATYYILNKPNKLPDKAVGLDAIVHSHKFTALTKPEADIIAAAKLEELRLEYREALKIRHVATELAADSSD